jgi:hypothetical protein
MLAKLRRIYLCASEWLELEKVMLKQTLIKQDVAGFNGLRT